MRLAGRYGLSDVGMAKICRKHNIPVPPRGYWAKKQAGHEPSKVPLPDPDNDYQIEVHVPMEPTSSSPAVRDAVAREEAKEIPIEVAKTLRGAHKLVSLANRELQSAKVDEHGLIIPPPKVPLDIRVTKGRLRRALLVMDALLKVLEERGHGVHAGPRVVLLGVNLRFGISESLETRQEEPEHHDLDGPYRFGHSRFDQKRVASGRLELQIDHGQAYWSLGCRRTWRDGKKQRLEDSLSSVVRGLVKLAGRLKEHDEEQRRRAQELREEEQRRQEVARIRAEKAALIEAERARVGELIKSASSWQTSQTLRAFIEATKKAHAAECGSMAHDSEFKQWIAWAIQQADRLDPLRESPPSILDEDVSEVEEQGGRFSDPR